MAAEGPKEMYKLADPSIMVSERRYIMAKFVPASYYEGKRLYIEDDVLKMMEQYRNQIMEELRPKEIEWQEYSDLPQISPIEGVSGADC